MATIKLPYIHVFRDRHGKQRTYFRRSGFKQIPLRGSLGSPEFMEAYQVALAGTEQTERVGPKLKSGTIAALAQAYFRSTDFYSLSDESQRVRRNILERFVAEHGDKRASELRSKHVQQMIDGKKSTPFAAQNFLKSLRSLMAFGMAVDVVLEDPTQGLRVKVPETDGFEPWDEEHIDSFEATHPIGTRARLAMSLLLYTAQRRSDVIRMGQQHISQGAIKVRQKKTGTSLLIPIHPDLQKILDGTRSRHLTFLTTNRGKPFSEKGFGNWFRKCCDKAGLPKGFSAHGLRKAACRRLAEAGCSVREIAAISGHKSLREVERYTRSADQALMAQSAIKRLTSKT